METRFDWLVIDGFSLLYREPECAALQRAGRTEVARRLLLTRLARETHRLAQRITVVFDGRGEGGASAADSEAGLDVQYSPAGLSADAVIERMVGQAREPARITVITSDRLERDIVTAAGADSMGCTDFLTLCAQESDALRVRARRRPPPRVRLGDLFPPARPSGP